MGTPLTIAKIMLQDGKALAAAAEDGCTTATLASAEDQCGSVDIIMPKFTNVVREVDICPCSNVLW